MKPWAIVVTILAAGAVAGLVAALVLGGIPGLFQRGMSEGEERRTCEAALKARVGSFMLGGSPTSQREEWPHSVWFAGVGRCRFARDGTMTVELD
jgi:hypothetical protein